jgi:D-threo-aldose 1-dehydrogenase
LLEQAPIEDRLPKCVARGVSIVVGRPLNSGILAGRDTWNYDTAPPKIAASAKKIGAVCKRHGVPLPAAALQFPLAHPAVAAVIPGQRDVAEFADNLKLLQLPIPPALWHDKRAEKLLHPDAPTPR